MKKPALRALYKNIRIILHPKTELLLLYVSRIATNLFQCSSHWLPHEAIDNRVDAGIQTGEYE